MQQARDKPASVTASRCTDRTIASRGNCWEINLNYSKIRQNLSIFMTLALRKFVMAIDMHLYRLVLLGSIAISALSRADGYGQSVFMPGWRIETSESEVAHGSKNSYPAWNLIDGDAKTTWVYSAKDYRKPAKMNKVGDETYFISFRPDNPVMLDELKLMTGYNKSESLYYKNSRPIEIAIYDGYPYDWKNNKSFLRSDPVRRLTLTDKPGDKSIRLPKRRYESLYVVITKIKPGVVDDLCVSEIAPRIGGINALPSLDSFMYSPGTGDSCGCGAAFVLHTPAGRSRLIANYEYPRFEFSPDRKYVAGLHSREDETTSAWVVNVKTGQRVWNRTLPKHTQSKEFLWTKTGLKIPYRQYFEQIQSDGRTVGSLVWKTK